MVDNGDTILIVRVDGRQVVTIAFDQVPCEVTADVQLSHAATVEFEDAAGAMHRHQVPAGRG